MRPELPEWFSKVASPLLVFVAVLSAVLELQEALSSKNALAMSITLALLSLAWFYHAWTQRAESKVLSSARNRRRYGSWIRYGSIAAALLTLGVVAHLAFSALNSGQEHTGQQSVKPIPFEILNGAQTMPIWLGREAQVQILGSLTPIEDEVVASVRARVDMPTTFQFGGRFQIEPGGAEHGFINLPKRFDLQGYKDRGLALRLLVMVQPTDTLIEGDNILDDELFKEGIKLAYSP